MKLTEKENQTVMARRQALNSVNLLFQMAQREMQIHVKELIASKGLDLSKKYSLKPDGTIIEQTEKEVEEVEEVEEVKDSEESKEIKKKIEEIKKGE